MNLPRYKFHKESEPELVEFMKVVAGLKSTTSSDEHELWKKLLPQGEIASKLEILTAKETIIIESDEEACQKEDFRLPEQTFIELIENKSGHSVSDLEQLVDSIQELLETELLSEEVIKQLGSEYKQEDLENIFKTLGDKLTADQSNLLWSSICNSSCLERVALAKCYIQFILTHKVHDKDQKFSKLLKGIYSCALDKIISDEIIAFLLKLLDHTNRVLLKNDLALISDEHKQILFREYLNRCVKLEANDLEICLSLISKAQDVETVKKLINLMYDVGKEFANDKIFGKLLLEVVAVPQIACIKVEELRFLVTTHCSVYKSLLLREFNVQSSLSQSFRMSS